MPDKLSHAEQLTTERATNERYMRDLNERSLPLATVPRARNNEWTTTGRPRVAEVLVSPLAGRVALAYDDEDLGTDFYIGPWKQLEAGRPRVISWAAELARLFYETCPTAEDGVVLRRTLVPFKDSIHTFEDEWADEGRSQHPFAARKKWRLDLPPQVGAAPAPSTGLSLAPEDTTRTAPFTPGLLPPVLKGAPKAVPVPVPPVADGSHLATDGLRAPGAVVAALETPRQSQLTSVLATLQADQYDLARRPAGVPLIVQGHPGTGKTIVAVHRAAYLTDDSGPIRLKKVILVGPTRGYVRHVRRLVSLLDRDARVRVASLPDLLGQLACLTEHPTGHPDGASCDDTSTMAARLAESASTLLLERRRPGADLHSISNVKKAYELLRTNGSHQQRLTCDAEEVAWLKGLPEWVDAHRRWQYLPLLAVLGLTLRGAGHRYEHLLVDEAQDLRPIELQFLKGYAPPGSITLLGDMNQRRSDYTCHSWSQVAGELGLTASNGGVEPVVMSRGYRSTGAILRFAGRLLPRKERGAKCIRVDGTGVCVVSARTAELPATAMREASRLLTSHSGGRTAIITVTPEALRNSLKNAGWKASPVHEHEWERGDVVLSVLTPEASRGLEFDAVVVVEPSAFPTNLGRSGPLYTSLTRANKELAVVHAQRLPDGIR